MEILNAFSMPICIDFLENIDNQSLKYFCLEKSSEQNGQSFLLDWNLSPLKILSNLILTKVNEMHVECGLKYSQKISHVWCNSGKPNKITTPHTHPSFFTAIYYVTGGSRLGLVNPNNNIENLIPSNFVENYNSFNQLFQWIYPRPGLLIIHPSWLLHFVDDDCSNERISIAFNTDIIT